MRETGGPGGHRHEEPGVQDEVATELLGFNGQRGNLGVMNRGRHQLASTAARHSRPGTTLSGRSTVAKAKRRSAREADAPFAGMEI